MVTIMQISVLIESVKEWWEKRDEVDDDEKDGDENAAVVAVEDFSGA